jgi:hypothetical protein
MSESNPGQRPDRFDPIPQRLRRWRRRRTSNTVSRAIAPGPTVTLTAEETVLAPGGTTVFDPARNNTVLIARDHNTVNTPGGSQVIVPSIATGAPDNTVIAR